MNNDVVLASKKDIQVIYVRNAKVCYDPVVLSSPSLQGLQSTFNRPFVETDTPDKNCAEQTVNVCKWCERRGFAIKWGVGSQNRTLTELKVQCSDDTALPCPPIRDKERGLIVQ